MVKGLKKWDRAQVESGNRDAALIRKLIESVGTGNLSLIDKAVDNLVFYRAKGEILEALRGVRLELSSFRCVRVEVALRELGLSQNTDSEIASWAEVDETTVARNRKAMRARRMGFSK